VLSREHTVNAALGAAGRALDAESSIGDAALLKLGEDRQRVLWELLKPLRERAANV
jgi:hypothetical protein